MSAQKPDYYAVLGVSADSTFGAIRKAFFKLSLAHHPDRRDKSEFEEAHKEFVLISAAYNVLKDKESRHQYDSTRARRMQRPTAQSHFNGGDAWFNQENNTEDAFEPRGSQFPGNPRFYADQSERDARERQRARRADREHPRQWETDSDSDDPENTGANQPGEPHEVPHLKKDDETSPEEEAWLRFRTAKNNLQGLSFSLRDALYMVLETIRHLRKVDAVKPQAAKSRAQLRFIEAYFSTLQIEMDSVHSPMWLTEATVIRVKKMMMLEEHIRDLLGLLKARPPADEPSSPEEEAITTSKLVLKAMNTCAQLY
ncbi:hypothetical protein INS49_013603 [Diaporthe citri]|uniref:uncharacterized protein n=1 Tax=Diaporthe citri TaxID=83186 RepID=UPI001C7E8ED6|nr:uncharacterized protein INS49_013603 [Diaporthe citri]KAG6357724.1 hypothetical protein INS49_013603 [Diaporthe citri]